MENEQSRKNGISVLLNLIDLDTATKIENAAWKQYGEEQKNYTKCIYQIYGDLTNNKQPHVIIDQIRKYNWEHETYTDEKVRQQEQDDFVTSPAEVEEGVLECKCGSKRTISFTLQTRSGDEGTSVWARCVECGNKWQA